MCYLDDAGIRKIPILKDLPLKYPESVTYPVLGASLHASGAGPAGFLLITLFYILLYRIDHNCYANYFSEVSACDDGS